MRPALFRYCRPESLEEALELKAQYGDEASVLAGGQSLMPMLNMRMARPAVLIDINRLSVLADVVEVVDGIRLGAVTRYSRFESDAKLSPKAPLLAMAMPLVAHAGVRNRGTLGGSLALADPAAESPACCICLEAGVILKSRARGSRKVPAQEFVQGTYITAIEPDEILEAIELPKPQPGQRYAIREVSVRHGDFALAGLCATATLSNDKLQNLRLVFFGLADRPIVASKAADILSMSGGKDREAKSEAAAALTEDIAFVDSSELSAKSRQHIATTLLERIFDDLRGVSAHG